MMPSTLFQESCAVLRDNQPKDSCKQPTGVGSEYTTYEDIGCWSSFSSFSTEQNPPTTAVKALANCFLAKQFPQGPSPQPRSHVTGK